MAKIKYSAIVGTLGQLSDRFLRDGYKEPGEIKGSFEEEVEALAALGVLDGLDLYYAEEGINSDAAAVNELFAKYNLAVGSVFPNVFGETRWKNGSIASTDENIRREAVELCKKGADFTAGLNGNVPMNLWLGQDGFDYPFQVDYDKAFDNLIKSIKEICDYRPDVMITVEAKIREPRNRCIIETVAMALLVCERVGTKNIGIAVDMGHTLQAQQNIAQNLVLAAKHGKLVSVHANDNYCGWDDDMIAGSVHTIEYLEMFYWLKKYNYDGFLAADIFPYRESTLGCTKETILDLKKFEQLVDMIGMKPIEEMIATGDPTHMTKFIREHIYK